MTEYWLKMQREKVVCQTKHQGTVVLHLNLKNPLLVLALYYIEFYTRKAMVP